MSSSKQGQEVCDFLSFVCFVFHLNVESSEKINVLSTLENTINIQRYMKNWHLFDRDIKTVKPEAKSTLQTYV